MPLAPWRNGENKLKLSDENKKWVDEVWNKLDAKLRAVSKRSYGKIPYTAINGIHDDNNGEYIIRWTNGFWAGLMWLMYVQSGEESYKKAAEKAEQQLDAALMRPEELHHDVGFMWHISSGVNYRLFGGEASKRRTLYAASLLASRYNPSGKFIRAWNGEGKEGWVIIDCLMNLPLLYWASEESKDKRFYHMAENHADTVLKSHIRDDGSVRHIVEFNPENGEVICTHGGQGCNENSAWSRGQAWALYGFAISYVHTKKEEYLNAAKRVAHYFIANCCDTWLPRVDFKAAGTSVDSTAGAIAACGLIEIAKNVSEEERELYLGSAIKMLKALENCCDLRTETDSVLNRGTEAYGKPEKPIIYGDFYFAEALYKLKEGTLMFW